MLSTYLWFVLYIYIGFILLIIPGILVAIWYMFAIPVTILEKVSGRSALRRSRELGRGFYWRNFGIITASIFIALAATLIVAILAEIIMFFILKDVYPLLFSAIGEALNIVLFGPLVSLSVILLYYDMRARKEGYDAVQLVEDLHI